MTIIVTVANMVTNIFHRMILPLLVIIIIAMAVMNIYLMLLLMILSSMLVFECPSGMRG